MALGKDATVAQLCVGCRQRANDHGWDAKDHRALLVQGLDEKSKLPECSTSVCRPPRVGVIAEAVLADVILCGASALTQDSLEYHQFVVAKRREQCAYRVFGW